MKTGFHHVTVISLFQAAMAVGVSAAWDDRFGLPGADNVSCLAVANGQVYVGGSFESIGNIRALNIARWDGTNWWALGSGTNCGVNERVEAIAVSGSDVYVGGWFTRAGDVDANYIARWDGTAWHALIEGTSNGVSRQSGTVVYSIAIDGGYVYVGGSFSNAGGHSANNISRWTGSSWTTMTVGVNSKVYAISAGGGYVYVGGEFKRAGSTNANYVARWDGFNWFPLGGGTYTGANGIVYALCADAGGAYVGGTFSKAGSLSVSNIARWDGADWSVLAGVAGHGVGGQVRSIKTQGTDVYAGGDFESAGGSSNVYRVAKWDGATWSWLGGYGSNGVDYAVRTIAFQDTDLYLGGVFTRVGISNTFASGRPAYRVAKWDGGWHAIDTGSKGCEDAVMGLTADASGVYAVGEFDACGATHTWYVARWDGATWHPLGEPPNDGVKGDGPKVVVAHRGRVYVGGQFTTAGGMPATNMACWNGTNWADLDGGMGSSVGGPDVLSLTVAGSNLYAGGYFETAGGVDATNIACWDGQQWHPLGDGISNGIGGYEYSYVYALCANGGDVYAGGLFSQAGGVGANSIARWDGQRWHALGSGDSNGVNGVVRALSMRGGDVYAGGSFSTAGGVAATNVARWDGSNWYAFTAGPDNGIGGVFEGVYCLAVCGSNLYAGGDFTNAGPTGVHYVARWTGAAWVGLEEGVRGDTSDPYAYAMTVVGSNLFVGGNFRMAGSTPSYRFGIWNEPGVGDADSDGDGLNDAWEREHFGNLSSARGSSDYDGDQFTEVQEQLGRTDPTDALSFLAETLCQRLGGGGFLVRWTSASNQEYTVSRLTNFSADGFVGIFSNIAGVPPENTYTDTTASGRGVGIYRVELE